MLLLWPGKLDYFSSLLSLFSSTVLLQIFYMCEYVLMTEISTTDYIIISIIIASLAAQSTKVTMNNEK